MREKVRAVLKNVQPDCNFEDGVDFIEAGYLDSFTLVSLLAALESEFGIQVAPECLLPENFASVDAICALLEDVPAESGHE